MELYEIVKDIPAWVPLGLTGLAIAGMATQVAVNVHKGEKKLNAHFQELQDTYRSDFSKEELISFYEDLVKTVRPKLMGKKRKMADKMSEDLEKQIMTYATKETQEAIANGAVLSFRDPIEPYSPTYKRAIELFSSFKGAFP